MSNKVITIRRGVSEVILSRGCGPDGCGSCDECAPGPACCAKGRLFRIAVPASSRSNYATIALVDLSDGVTVELRKINN